MLLLPLFLQFIIIIATAYHKIFKLHTFDTCILNEDFTLSLFFESDLLTVPVCSSEKFLGESWERVLKKIHYALFIQISLNV